MQSWESNETNQETRMHSSRMRTAHSLIVSPYLIKIPMHAPPSCHAHPPSPCMPPLHHACPPSPHTPLSPCTPPQLPHTPPSPCMLPPSPCMPPSPCTPPFCHACPPFTTPPGNHAHPLATINAPHQQPHTHPQPPPPPCRQTDTCKNITFANFVRGR